MTDTTTPTPRARHKFVLDDTGPGPKTITLDGEHIENTITQLNIEVRPGRFAIATVELVPQAVHAVAVGDLRTDLEKRTRSLLILAGWTPPADEQ